MMAEEKKNNPLGGLGGLGNIGNIMDAMKKAQEFSSSAKDLQAELKETEIEATVRDGAVKIVLTGQQQPVQVVVSDELASQGGEEVSKAVTECLVAAHAKVGLVLFKFMLAANCYTAPNSVQCQCRRFAMSHWSANMSFFVC